MDTSVYQVALDWKVNVHASSSLNQTGTLCTYQGVKISHSQASNRANDYPYNTNVQWKRMIDTNTCYSYNTLSNNYESACILIFIGVVTFLFIFFQLLNIHQRYIDFRVKMKLRMLIHYWYLIILIKII